MDAQKFTAASASSAFFRATGDSQRSSAVADRSQQVAVAVRRKRRTNGLRLYQATWKAVRELFIDTDKLKNWDKWEHRFDGKIRSVSSAISCANEMLASLKDTYTELGPRTAEEKDNEPIVTTRRFHDNVGYIRLRTFNSGSTAKELKRGLREVQDCSALIVDLRGNSGGYIHQAIDCASQFIPQGRIVSFEERLWRQDATRNVQVSGDRRLLNRLITAGGIERRHSSRRRYRCQLSPVQTIILLVDKDTASWAELFTGALKDNGRAIVLGERTYGKGIGQSFRYMPNGTELSVTTLRWYTPSGFWPGDARRNRKGLSPDVAVHGKGRIWRSSLKRDKQLQQALRICGVQEIPL